MTTTSDFSIAYVTGKLQTRCEFTIYLPDKWKDRKVVLINKKNYESVQEKSIQEKSKKIIYLMLDVFVSFTDAAGDEIKKSGQAVFKQRDKINSLFHFEGIRSADKTEMALTIRKEKEQDKMWIIKEFLNLRISNRDACRILLSIFFQAHKHGKLLDETNEVELPVRTRVKREALSNPRVSFEYMPTTNDDFLIIHCVGKLNVVRPCVFSIIFPRKWQDRSIVLINRKNINNKKKKDKIYLMPIVHAELPDSEPKSADVVFKVGEAVDCYFKYSGNMGSYNRGMELQVIQTESKTSIVNDLFGSTLGMSNNDIGDTKFSLSLQAREENGELIRETNEIEIPYLVRKPAKRKKTATWGKQPDTSERKRQKIAS